MSTQNKEPRITNSLVSYIKDKPIYQQEKPFIISSAFEDITASTNIDWEEQSESFEDIRGNESFFTLDSHGFTFVEQKTPFLGWNDRRAVEESYLPEVENLVRRCVPGADEVVIFDWRRRTSDPSMLKSAKNLNDPTDLLRAVQYVHVDTSSGAVLKRVKRLMGERAESLLQKRIRVVNIWRPLKVVQNWPIGLCDGSNVSANDFLEADGVRKGYVSATLFAKYKPGYRWYYLKDQTPDEVCLFKNFDSDRGVKAAVCPHVSFQQGGAEMSRARESIEVRALIFSN